MQGRGLPPGARRRASAAKVCTSEARKIGDALVAARGVEPTRKAWFPYSPECANRSDQVWRCGFFPASFVGKVLAFASMSKNRTDKVIPSVAATFAMF